MTYYYSICHSFPKLVDWGLKGQCRLKRLPFIILQPLKKQHLQWRSLYTRWSSASEPDPSDTRVSPDICVLILSSHIPRNSKLARASLQASCIVNIIMFLHYILILWLWIIQKSAVPVHEKNVQTPTYFFIQSWFLDRLLSTLDFHCIFQAVNRSRLACSLRFVGCCFRPEMMAKWLKVNSVQELMVVSQFGLCYIHRVSGVWWLPSNIDYVIFHGL